MKNKIIKIILRTIIFIVLFIDLSTLSQSELKWEIVSINVLPPLTDVAFIDSLNGIASVDSNLIYKTNDGGRNWSMHIINSNLRCKNISFIDKLNGWIIGNKLYRTTDGGETWYDLDIDMKIYTRYIQKLIFTSSVVGYLLYNGRIYISNDGGLNWILGMPYNYAQYTHMSSWGIIRNNTGNIYIYGKSYENYPSTNSSYYLIKLLNGQITGDDHLLFTDYRSIFSKNESTFWLMEKDSYNAFTNNKFKTINAIKFDSVEKVKDIAFLNEKEGWAVGTNGLIMFTDDGGNKWKKVQSNTKLNLSKIIQNGSDCWIFGDSGIVLHNSFVSGFKELLKEDVSFKISPNPATDFIDISVEEKHAFPLQIRIYDVFGQLANFTPHNPLTPVTKGELGSSSQYSLLNTQYSTKIDVSSLAPGLYFVRVGEKVGKFLKI